MTDPVQVNGLCKAYRAGRGLKRVYEDFSLRIADSARLVCLMGPDGAGKSTLMKLLAGVLRPDQGQVRLCGMVPDSSDLAFTSKVGYMSQTLGLYGELTVRENLEIFAALRGMDVRKNAADLDGILRKVGLFEFSNRQADSLSGGMKQKLGLACAVCACPRCLILDEPTVGVDPVSRQELWAITFDYVRREGAFCLFSSAYLEEAAAADQAVMLQNGRIVLQGAAAQLRTGLQGRTFAVSTGDLPYTATVRRLMFSSRHFLDDSPLLDICPRMGRIDVLAAPGATVQSLGVFLKEKMPDAAFGLKVAPREPQLEDVYVAHTLDFSQKTALPDPGAAFERRTVIDVRGICKRFGSFTAVRHSDFKVQKGEIFGLLGPNGAGKTTTFRMICALLKPTEGQVTVGGYDLRTAKSDLRAHIGYVSQKFSLYRKLTARQNLEYFGRSYGISGSKLKKRVEELLDEFSLRGSADDLSESLPFGLQRQLSMACALIHRPEVLFLDEATSGADPMARRTFWNRVCALSSGGTTVVVTTHFMDEAEYCDRFLIQDRGRILVLGTPDEVCTQGGRRVSIEDAFVALVHQFRQQEGRHAQDA